MEDEKKDKPGDALEGANANERTIKSKRSHNLSRRDALLKGLVVAGLTPLTLAQALSPDSEAQAGQGGQLLVQRREGVVKKAEALFARMAEDKALQNSFIENPTSVLASQCLDAQAARSVSARRMQNANRVLFSVLANAEFRAWLEEYGRKVVRETPSKAQAIKDFSAAIVKYGAVGAVQGILEDDAIGGQERLAMSNTVLVADGLVLLVDVVAVVVGIFVIVVVAVAAPGPGLTTLELRPMVDRLVAKADQLAKQGALTQSYVQ